MEAATRVNDAPPPADPPSSEASAVMPPKHRLITAVADGHMWFGPVTLASLERAEATADGNNDVVNGRMFRLLAATAAALIQDAGAPADAKAFVLRHLHPRTVTQGLTRVLLLEHDGVTHAALITPTDPFDPADEDEMQDVVFMAGIAPAMRTHGERPGAAPREERA